MKYSRLFPAVIAAALVAAFQPDAQAVLANAWHIPDDSTDLGFNMRNPEFEIGSNSTVTVYSGIQKLNNSFGTANQTGGWVVYKGATQGTWSSNALAFYQNGGPSPNNQYWSSTFNTTNFGPDEVIQYYLYLKFDGVNSVSNTCVYGGDGASSTTGDPNVAAASPFTIRNRPAWLFHSNNRVVTPNVNSNSSTVSYWIEIGYQSKDATLRYADNAVIYYTTDGSTPAGALGVPSGTTQVIPMAYDHEQDNPSPAGNAMWWVGTDTNTPNYNTINYKIGVWNSQNNEEKFADYNAGSPNTVFSYSNGTLGAPALTVNGLNADYTTEHLFVDEVAGDSIPVNVVFSPNTNGVVEADVFSNLNRRDRATKDANGDGVEDGILPPDGNTIPTGDDNNYYKAYAMTSIDGGQYSLTLYATNCGVYRLTARYMVAGNTNWFWYSGNGLRDHVLVVSPTRARNMVMYELNAMNVDAQSTNQVDRSTFTDLYNGPGSRPYDPVTNRFNLTYAQNLGINWLWFQPIHPIGIFGRLTNAATGLPYTVGSPYSIKNFFQVNPLLGKAHTRPEAMQEFTNFVAAANTADVNVMMDEPFADTSWDCELDVAGVNYFAPGANPTNEISASEARFYSYTNEYDERASDANNIAVSPDRYDFGKWDDTAHVYWGRYAALVPNQSQETNYLSEADWFDYTTGQENATGTGNGHFDPITQNVWRYFSDSILYWLNLTGCPSNTPPNLTANKGIGGLRADFGQGLPPQAWEYIVNKVRSQKWDFVFMCEALDGGVVSYRCNRQFDVLNENLIFDLQNAQVAGDYRSAFDARRTEYGQSVILLDNTDHDEQTYADPFEALIRYMTCGAIDGVPMTFYGQELGISTDFGFDQYEEDFGQNIPSFEVFNDLQPICNPANRTYGLDQLFPVYSAINDARDFSAALKSPNRYYLNQIGSEVPQNSIFSVAKYQNANGAPNFSDVVFAFNTLDRNNAQVGVFDVNITENGSNLFGIQSNRLYNVKNISAYTAIDSNRRNYWLWNNGTGGTYGSNVLASGIYVSLNPVPTSNAGWSGTPFEAQYLKLYDVTPPPTPAMPTVGTTNNYLLTNVVTFTWPAVVDNQGGISGYLVLVGTTPGGDDAYSNIVNGTSLTLTNTFGTHLYATVSAVNNAGIVGPASTAATVALVNPAWIPLANMNKNRVMIWNSVSGKTYQVWSTTNLSIPFAAYSGMLTSLNSTLSYTNSATNGTMYFKVQFFP